MLAHLYHFELPGVRVTGIQQDIERLGDHGRWHPQQRGTTGLHPAISNSTRAVRLFEPVSRKIGREQVFNDESIGRAKLQQAVARRQIANVDLEMNQDLQQRRCRTLATVNNSTTACMPAARRSHPAIAGQRNVVADSPQDHLRGHAIVDAIEQFFDESCTRLCDQQVERCSSLELTLGVTKPPPSALVLTEHFLA